MPWRKGRLSRDEWRGSNKRLPFAIPPRHVPVLPDKVLEYLAPQAGQTIVDCTVGGGGHSRLIAQQLGPQGRLIGLDQDEKMLEQARRQLDGLPVTLIHANFDQLRP